MQPRPFITTKEKENDPLPGFCQMDVNIIIKQEVNGYQTNKNWNSKIHDALSLPIFTY
jgi:hypothetical protein